jgi:hypothetical protein
VFHLKSRLGREKIYRLAKGLWASESPALVQIGKRSRRWGWEEHPSTAAKIDETDALLVTQLI